MKRPRTPVYILSCLLAASLAVPAAAQTQIGGGTCSSSTLSGTYALSLTGRQVTSSGNFTNVIQGNGSATFDGLSAVKVTMTADTVQAVAAPLNWTGTYSIQSNCAGVVTITSGGSATLNLVLYNQGTDFLVAGNDATYSYSGSGNKPPGVCSTSLLSGVYTFNATGFTISSTAVTGTLSGAGLLQFDGQGKVTLNASANGKSTGALAGSYSVSSNCLGSATVTGAPAAGTYTLTFSVTGGNSTATTDFFIAMAQPAVSMTAGNAHAIYGQPVTITTGAYRRPAGKTFAKLWSQIASIRRAI